MPLPVRNALVLAGCLIALVATGFVAVFALRSASVPAARLTTTVVAVDANDAGGTARLTVLNAVRAGSGGTVPAGTMFTTTNDILTAALGADAGSPAGPAVGATLSCDLLVRVDRGQPVIDVQRCTPATTSPRG